MKKTVFFIAALCSIVASAQYDIFYNLEKGKKYPQNQVVLSEQDQVVNGMPQEMSTTINSQTDYLVTDIKDGIYYIDIIQKMISNDTQTAMGKQTMSSDGPQSDPMNQLFKNMIAHPIKITMSNKGEILSFDNSAQLKGLTANMEMPEMQLLQIESAMIKEISADKQTASFEMITGIFPDKKVNVGDTWQKTVTISSISTFEATNTFKLESVTDDSYTVSCSSLVSTPDDGVTEIMGMKATYDLEGPMSGTYTIDRNTGWILKANLEQQLDGDITIAKSESMPQEMNMTMKTKTTTVIE